MAAPAEFTVIVADNLHYMDESEHYVHGRFPAAELAVRAAQDIVDAYLEHECEPGMTADELFARYRMFGEDPFIVAVGAEQVHFSARDYARSRCAAVVAARQPR